ncbi:Hypothetical predicted protein [Marmota monax]|uniref:Uncharacterized protein n=1 Tax=Marmota monax TaxID=9995 RepID=A0A5E4CNL2_MARMO|nr:Hypothetical predicted protein [Marmota monax]
MSDLGPGAPGEAGMWPGLHATETTSRPCAVPVYLHRSGRAAQPGSPQWSVHGPGGLGEPSAPLLIVLDLKEGHVQEPALTPPLYVFTPHQLSSNSQPGTSLLKAVIQLHTNAFPNSCGMNRGLWKSQQLTREEYRATALPAFKYYVTCACLIFFCIFIVQILVLPK